MITQFQALILGSLQGLSELFPISSLGHTVVLPQVFGWSINQHDEKFVIFIVATHVATALVLLVYYWSDWWNIIRGFFRSVKARKVEEEDVYAKISWLLVAGTVPAGALGLLFDKKFEALFARPSQAAFFLVVNGLILYGAEMMRRKREALGGGVEQNIARLSYTQAFGIGAAQALALIPGISRTGSAMAGGLLAKLTHEEAITFAFLLATPIIFAAGVLKLPKLLHASGTDVLPILLGSLLSALFAYLSVSFLSRWFKTKTLTPFAVYCIAFGAFALTFLG